MQAGFMKDTVSIHQYTDYSSSLSFDFHQRALVLPMSFVLLFNWPRSRQDVVDNDAMRRESRRIPIWRSATHPLTKYDLQCTLKVDFPLPSPFLSFFCIYSLQLN